MLKSMGWEEGTGLGIGEAAKRAVVEPIKVRFIKVNIVVERVSGVNILF